MAGHRACWHNGGMSNKFYLLRLLARAGESLSNPFVGRSYVQPRHGDAARDFARISGDMRTVGADLRRVAQQELQHHGRR